MIWSQYKVLSTAMSNFAKDIKSTEMLCHLQLEITKYQA